MNSIGYQGFSLEGIEITDRYQALGSPYPDVETMCEGQCEGTGYVPLFGNNKGDLRIPGDEEEPWRSLWLEAEARKSSKDGWHFVVCPDCDGTGKKK